MPTFFKVIYTDYYFPRMKCTSPGTPSTAKSFTVSNESYRLVELITVDKKDVLYSIENYEFSKDGSNFSSPLPLNINIGRKFEPGRKYYKGNNGELTTDSSITHIFIGNGTASGALLVQDIEYIEDDSSIPIATDNDEGLEVIS